MDYAIIKLGNKQHRVRHGETLVVDRLPADEGKSFEPVVLLGEAKVTATVIAHGRGPKIVIGKYRKRTGYKRHNGFRAAVSRVEISLADGSARKKGAAAAPKPAPVAVESVTSEPPVASEPTVSLEPAAVSEAMVVSEPVVTDPGAPESATPELAEDDAAATGAQASALPEGYDGMTVAQITAGAKQWSVVELDSALAYEREHAARKGAIAALESARAKGEE